MHSAAVEAESLPIAAARSLMRASKAGIRGIPPGTAMRTRQRIIALVETSPKLTNRKRNTKSRYVVQPRGVSSFHVFYWAFGDASTKTWDLRHATFIFRAGAAGLSK